MEKKRKGNLNCCVRSCKNVFKNTSTDIKFYAFPTAEYKAIQCQEWKRWIRKTNGTPDWEPKKNTRICSAHFVGNCKSSMPRNPSYAPIIVTRKELPEMQPEDKSAIQRFERGLTRKAYGTKCHKDKVNVNNLSESSDLTETSKMDEQHTSIPFQIDKEIQVKMFGTTAEHSRLFDGTKAFICTQYVRNGICEAQTQAYIPQILVISEIVKKKMNYDKCCGTQTVKSLEVGPDILSSMKCRTGYHSISLVKNDQDMLELAGVTLTTFKLLVKALPDNKFKKISLEKRLFLFLTKLKTGLSFNALSVLFRVHRTTASRIFIEVLKSIRVACDRFIPWPSREIVQKSMPEDFKQLNKNCRVIIDIAEIKLEPGTVENRVFTYSHHKNGSTAKFLVGCTPSGLISFVSSCYGGRTSDSKITIDSEILNLLQPGDVVLANKGFPEIQTVFDKAGKGDLIVLPSLLRNFQCSDEEEGTAYRVARIKIHIDRIMQRLRTYKILDKFSIDILPHADSITFMCGVLANLQPRIPTLQCKSIQCQESIVGGNLEDVAISDVK